MRLSFMYRALLVLPLVAGCWSAAPAVATEPTATGPVERPPPIALDRMHGIPGEVMEYVGRFRGIAVGKIQVAVGRPGMIGDRNAIIVKSRAVGEGMIALVADYVGELTTTIDLDRGLPISMTKEEWMTLNGNADHNLYSRSFGEDDHHDVQSAAGALRGWSSSRAGDRGTLIVGIGGTAIDVEILDAGRTVWGPGNRPAVRYDGLVTRESDESNERARHAFIVWISDDAARVPLRVFAKTKWGSVSAELVHYEAPLE